MKPNYENDDKLPDHCTVAQYSGVACFTLGWELEPNDDTEWTGIEERTGRVLVCMVGDDRYFTVDPDDITPIDEGEYCPECGQVGCVARMNPLKYFRESRGLSQAELAAILGVSQALITHYECGRRNISAEKAVQYERRTGGALTRAELRPDLFGAEAAR